MGIFERKYLTRATIENNFFIGRWPPPNTTKAQTTTSIELEPNKPAEPPPVINYSYYQLKENHKPYQVLFYKNGDDPNCEENFNKQYNKPVEPDYTFAPESTISAKKAQYQSLLTQYNKKFESYKNEELQFTDIPSLQSVGDSTPLQDALNKCTGFPNCYGLLIEDTTDPDVPRVIYTYKLIKKPSPTDPITKPESMFNSSGIDRDLLICKEKFHTYVKYQKDETGKVLSNKTSTCPKPFIPDTGSMNSKFFEETKRAPLTEAEKKIAAEYLRGMPPDPPVPIFKRREFWIFIAFALVIIAIIYWVFIRKKPQTNYDLSEKSYELPKNSDSSKKNIKKVGGYFFFV